MSWLAKTIGTFINVGILIFLCSGEQLGASRHNTRNYEWPQSDRYNRVIVNATQGIEIQPREWFASDKLVTDFSITNLSSVGQAKAIQEYQATRQLLSSYGLAVGTYVSAVTVSREADETQWPWESVPSEWMPPTARYVGTWPGIPTRNVIDVSDPATRHALQSGIRRLWTENPAPVRFIDNAGIHRSAGSGAPWKAYCENIAEIRHIGEALGSRQIFNLALHVGYLSDEETVQLMRAVGTDGIALETPWHDNIRMDPVLTEKAKRRYRQLLDSGMAIIMLPLDGPPSELVAWVRSWRKPTDHVYISGLFYTPPDPGLFGAGN